MTGRVFRYLFLGAGAALSVYPFVWMLATSLKALREASLYPLALVPEQWHWHNYADTLDAAPFATYFFNTFVTAIAVTLAVLFTSISAGYAFARLDFPLKGSLFAVLLATMMIPFEVVLIPNFITITRLGWYDTYAALIVPWCASAFSIFLARQAFLGIPGEYYDAARIDGCGHLRFLARIAVPMARPTLIAVALFAFLGSYNALLWPLVVTGNESMRVVQVGLTVFATTDGVRVNLLMCAAVIVIVPTLGLYFLAQRYFFDASIGAGLKG